MIRLPNEKQFLRAAKKHWEAAVSLSNLNRNDLNFITVYLAGYVFECALKAVLLKWTPSARKPMIAVFFRGAQGHDLWLLHNELKRRNCPMQRQQMSIVRAAAWAPDLRYHPHFVLQRDAEDFLRDAKAILEWAERSVSA